MTTRDTDTCPPSHLISMVSTAVVTTWLRSCISRLGSLVTSCRPLPPPACALVLVPALAALHHNILQYSTLQYSTVQYTTVTITW